MQNETSQDRNLVVPIVASIIRHNRFPNLRTKIADVAKESNRSVPEIEDFFTGVQNGTIPLPRVGTTAGQTTAQTTPPNLDTLIRQYERPAVAFWTYFSKHGQLDSLTDRLDQIAADSQIEPARVRSLFESVGTKVNTK